MSREEAWNRLSGWTNLPMPAYDGMRWRPVTNAARPALSILGTSITKALAHPCSMRFCPSCLASDGIRRDLWSLACVVACPLHRCLLVEACTACGERFDAAPNGPPLACRCGLRFDLALAEAAPPPAIRVARNLALIVGTQASIGAAGSGWTLELSPSFVGMGANDYMAHIEVLGTASTTPAEDDPIMRGTARRYANGATSEQLPIPTVLARIEAATTIMDRWPDAFFGLLSDLQERGGGVGAMNAASAFPTLVGRSLVRPIRGVSGLPLPLVHRAVDDYWRLHGPAGHRRRNLTVSSAAALRLHHHLNATALAAAVGDRLATGLHARILRRVLDESPAAELASPPADAANLALRRGTARHAAVTEAITGHAAARILEGRAAKDTLSGWDHPRLLPVDPALQGLRFKDGPVYAPAGVLGALARLRAACRRPTRPDDLSPLVSVAMRLAPLRPWYDKTALLLDVFDGAVPIFATIDDPRLEDLLVDLPSLKAHVAMRDPALRSEHASLPRVNEVLRIRLGQESAIRLEEARRLVRAGAVGFVLEKSTVANRQRPVVKRLYRVADMVAAAERRLAREASQDTVGEAMEIRCDIADKIARFRDEGNTLRATARALSKAGILTINGARWRHAGVSAALARAAAGHAVPAVMTRTASR
jgi:hypothetical protein